MARLISVGVLTMSRWHPNRSVTGHPSCPRRGRVIAVGVAQQQVCHLKRRAPGIGDGELPPVEVERHVRELGSNGAPSILVRHERFHGTRTPPGRPPRQDSAVESSSSRSRKSGAAEVSPAQTGRPASTNTSIGSRAVVLAIDGSNAPAPLWPATTSTSPEFRTAPSTNMRGSPVRAALVEVRHHNRVAVALDVAPRPNATPWDQ